MIGMLRGNLAFSGERYVILDVGGVGYKIFVSPNALKKIPQKPDTGNVITLWTHLYVREDALDLYGFLEKAEVEFFATLISISGVGPKSAMGILGVAPIDVLKQAIGTGDTSYLTKVSGIGRKTAEKIVLELRDKFSGSGLAGGLASELRGEQDALEALESLGYSLREARDALQAVDPKIEGVEARIKAALQALGKPRK